METQQTGWFLRRAEKKDVEALSGLIASLFSIEKDFAVDLDKQRKALQLLLADERSAVFCVEAAGRVIAMASVQSTISTAEGGYSALVEDVVVDQAFRSQGIGAQLINAIADWARTRGIRRVQLLADMDNSSALAFYGHLGFKATNMRCYRTYLVL